MLHSLTFATRPLPVLHPLDLNWAGLRPLLVSHDLARSRTISHHLASSRTISKVRGFGLLHARVSTAPPPLYYTPLPSQAGLWALPTHNHIVGNRFANSFNGMFFQAAHSPTSLHLPRPPCTSPHLR